jgi:tRNA modification GTPase
VEQIGVERSRAAAESADVVLLVYDGSEPLTEQDRKVSSELQIMGFGEHIASDTSSNETYQHRRPVVVVVNKADQPLRLEVSEIGAMWPQATFVKTSTLTGEGLAALEEAIADLVLAGKVLSNESVLVTNVRHQEALRQAAEHLQASVISLEQGLPLDFVSIDLRAAYDALGEVTGETASEDLLDKIFSEFCIGK